MTKADLIEEVSRVVEMTRKESEVIVEAIFDSIVRSPLRGGDKIEIRGFGSFRTRGNGNRAWDAIRRRVRGWKCPAIKSTYFKPSKELKDVVNAGAKPAWEFEAGAGRRGHPRLKPVGLSLESLALPVSHASARRPGPAFSVKWRRPTRMRIATLLISGISIS